MRPRTNIVEEFLLRNGGSFQVKEIAAGLKIDEKTAWRRVNLERERGAPIRISGWKKNGGGKLIAQYAYGNEPDARDPGIPVPEFAPRRDWAVAMLFGEHKTACSE